MFLCGLEGAMAIDRSSDPERVLSDGILKNQEYAHGGRDARRKNGLSVPNWPSRSWLRRDVHSACGL